MYLCICVLVARNAVIVVLTAGIAAVLKDIYSIEGLTLTKEVEAGLPVPAVPKFSLEYVDHDTNQTVVIGTQKIFGVSYNLSCVLRLKYCQLTILCV